MPEEMNDWGRRLDAGETGDDELKLAARLRAARPPVQAMPSATEAAIRTRVLNSQGKKAQPGWSLNLPRLNAGWWAATALSGVVVVLLGFMFSVLGQPLPANQSTPVVVAATQTSVPFTPAAAIACDASAGTVQAQVTSATFDPNVPLPAGKLDLALLVDTVFSPTIAERAMLYVGFASPERAAAWNTTSAGLAPDGVEGLARQEISAGQRTTVVRLPKIETDTLYTVAKDGRVAVFLAVVCNADTVSPSVLLSTVQTSFSFVLPVAGLPEGTLPGSYTARAGDTCQSIAQQFNVALEDLLAANRATLNADCSNLTIGQTLVIPLAFSGAGDEVRIVAAKPEGGWLTNDIEVTVAYTLTTVTSATLQIAYVSPNWSGDFSAVQNPLPWEGGLEVAVSALGGNQNNATVIVRVPAEDRAEVQRLAENGQVVLYAALTHVDGNQVWSRLAYDIARENHYELPGASTCGTPSEFDRITNLGVALAPESTLPNAPMHVLVEVEYSLESTPLASLTLGWADPEWDGALPGPDRLELYRYVSNSTSLMVSSDRDRVLMRGLVYAPNFSASVARDGRLALWVALACGPTGERATWLYSQVWPEFTYKVPPLTGQDAVSVAAAALPAGSTLPNALTPIDVTVNYTLTTAPTATLQIGLANDEWPGSQVEANAGTIFAVGAQPVVVSAENHTITVPFVYNPASAREMLGSGGVRLFATLTYQNAFGDWEKLAYELSREFVYQLEP